MVRAFFLFCFLALLAFMVFMSFITLLLISANVARETVMPCATRNSQRSICYSVSGPFQPTKLTPEAVNDQHQFKLRFPSSDMPEADAGSDEKGFRTLFGVATVLIIELAGLAFSLTVA